MSSLLVQLRKKNIIKGPKCKNPVKTTLGDYFFNYADQFGKRICQIDASLNDNNKETYSSVKSRSIRVALEMQNRGISSKDTVVIFTKVTLDTIIPLLACFYLGTKVANLDPMLSQKEIAHLLHVVSPNMIFVEDDYVHLLEESLKYANLTTDIVVFGQSVKHLTFDNFVKPQESEEDKFKPVKVNVNDIIVIIFGFPSGTAKAICHSHYTFLTTVQSCYDAGYTCNSVLYAGSFYRYTSWILMSCAFQSGGQRIFYRNYDPRSIFQIIQQYKVSKSSNYDTSSVGCVIVTGAPISADLYHAVNTLFTKAIISSAYGLKEAGVVILVNTDKGRESFGDRAGSSGKLAPGITAKIVDIDTNEIVGPDKIGEIRIKAETMMKGYWDADSSIAFDKDGFLKTGDMGYFDEQEYFYVVDRVSEVFKYLSLLITPSMIENVLMEHPAVREALVFGIPTEEEGEIPTAEVVVSEGSKITEVELVEFVAAKLTDRYRLRGGVRFVQKLPKHTGHIKSLTWDKLKESQSVLK